MNAVEKGDDSRLFVLTLCTLPVIAIIWWAMFVWRPVNFWLMMVTAQSLMIGVSLWMKPGLVKQLTPQSWGCDAGHFFGSGPLYDFFRRQ